MVRTQIQLEKELYEKIRQMAFESRQSFSQVIRTLLRKSLVKKEAKKKYRFSFIGMGSSDKQDISIDHDQYLEDAFR